MQSEARESGIVLRLVEETIDYRFDWWDGVKENYDRCSEYEIVAAATGMSTGRIFVAIGHRDAYGRSRRRILVFRDQNNVLAEFVGADDFEKSGLVLWLLKKENSREDVSPLDELPKDYRRFACVPFNLYVTGPWARKGYSVVVHELYHPILVEVALIRESHHRESTK